MNSKHYSIPYGMIFKKYYCSKCAALLQKEQTHRVVTKDDKDYYRYHNLGEFPKHDCDVYGKRFKCPNCNTRISFEEQCAIERIQKKFRKKLLSDQQIKDNYTSARAADIKRSLLSSVLAQFIFCIAVFLITFLTTRSLMATLLFSSVYLLISVSVVFQRFKGRRTTRAWYSREEEAKLEILHAKSSNNRELVKASEKCYCFYCKSSMNSSEITNYLADGTALCPHCGIDSVIPDSINEPINEELISQMNEYWF